MSEHAEVTRDGYIVPLIGIPKQATLEACDLCGELVAMRDIEWTGC